jgi:hypothetical protein
MPQQKKYWGMRRKAKRYGLGQLPLLQGADQTGLSAGVTLPADQTPHHEQSTNPSASNMASSHLGKQSAMGRGVDSEVEMLRCRASSTAPGDQTV